MGISRLMFSQKAEGFEDAGLGLQCSPSLSPSGPNPGLDLLYLRSVLAFRFPSDAMSKTLWLNAHFCICFSSTFLPVYLLWSEGWGPKK